MSRSQGVLQFTATNQTDNPGILVAAERVDSHVAVCTTEGHQRVIRVNTAVGQFKAVAQLKLPQIIGSR